jgi:hypothetical protein
VTPSLPDAKEKGPRVKEIEHSPCIGGLGSFLKQARDLAVHDGTSCRNTGSSRSLQHDHLQVRRMRRALTVGSRDQTCSECACGMLLAFTLTPSPCGVW